MTTIKLSFLQWCVENAHLIVLDGFRDGVAGGLKNVTAILNKEIASATAASKLLRDMMLQAGWIEVENSQTLQLPDIPRNILEQQEAQAYSLRLANVRAALSAYEFDNDAAFEQAVADEMAPEEEGDEGEQGEDEEVVGAADVVAAHGENSQGETWDVQSLLDRNLPFYVKFEDEVYQMKVHSIDEVLQRPITVIWGESQNQGGCFNDHEEERNGYTHAQFMASARPDALVEHKERVTKLRDYGQRQFEISYDNDDWKAKVESVDDAGHFVTIKYVDSGETEKICIQAFFIRLTTPPKARKKKKSGASKSNSDNGYSRQYNKSKRSR